MSFEIASTKELVSEPYISQAKEHFGMPGVPLQDIHFCVVEMIGSYARILRAEAERWDPIKERWVKR